MRCARSVISFWNCLSLCLTIPQHDVLTLRSTRPPSDGCAWTPVATSASASASGSSPSLDGSDMVIDLPMTPSSGSIVLENRPPVSRAHQPCFFSSRSMPDFERRIMLTVADFLNCFLGSSMTSTAYLPANSGLDAV